MPSGNNTQYWWNRCVLDADRTGGDAFVLGQQRVSVGGGLAARNHVAPVTEFHGQERGLEAIEPRVAPDLEVVVFALGAVVGQSFHPGGKGFVARQHGTAVPKGAEVFAWEKAGGAELPSMPAGLPRVAIPSAPRLWALSSMRCMPWVSARAPARPCRRIGQIANHHRRLGLGRARALAEAGSIWKVSGWMSTKTWVAPLRPRLPQLK